MEAEPLQTARLLLPPLSGADAEALHVSFSNPVTMAYWQTAPHKSLQETCQVLDDMIKAEDSLWWGIRLRPQGRTVGFVGFLCGARPGGCAGMAYLLDSPSWGSGYATEAVEAVARYGFEQVGLDRVELWIRDDNRASRRLAERASFSYRGCFFQLYPGGSVRQTVVYGQDALEWHRGHSSPSLPQPSVEMLQVQPVLPVKSLERTLAAYRDQLGFRVDFTVGHPASHAGVSRGGWTPQRVALQFFQGRCPRQPAGWLTIQVGPDIETLYEEFRSKGVDMQGELKSLPWGLREFMIRDVNGYRLCFATPWASGPPR